jgi:hypothetical protein
MEKKSMPEKKTGKTDKNTGLVKAAAARADFYQKVLDKAEQIDFAVALGDSGIDDEIALLKVKIKAVVEKDPDNLKLILEATNLLAKLVKTRYSINREQKKGFKDALQNVIKEIAVPLGIAMINKKP